MALCDAAASMFKRRYLLISFVAAILVLLASRAWYRNWAAAQLEQSFGGAEVLAIVRQPDQVEALRLKDSTSRPALADYEVVGSPLPVDSTIAIRLSRILTDGASYNWSGLKSCTPTFGVRVRFTKGGELVDVLFCFQCDILIVFHNGHPVGFGNFDFAHGKLARLMKGLFPNDKGIQSIE